MIVERILFPKKLIIINKLHEVFKIAFHVNGSAISMLKEMNSIYFINLAYMTYLKHRRLKNEGFRFNLIMTCHLSFLSTFTFTFTL
jgi:hypothetical protein